MDYTIAIYTILAIIVVVEVFLLIMWSLSIQTLPTYAPAPQYTKAGFGSRCSTIEPTQGQNSPVEFQPQLCDVGLICVTSNAATTTGICLKDLGTDCTTLFE